MNRILFSSYCIALKFRKPPAKIGILFLGSFPKNTPIKISFHSGVCDPEMASAISTEVFFFWYASEKEYHVYVRIIF